MTAALRVKGHARRIEASNIHGTGMYRRADGYTVVCSCREWSEGVSSTEQGVKAHEAHKATVASGAHAAAIEAERTRRIEMHEETLRQFDAGGMQHFTREQILGYIEAAKTGTIRL